jgi:hypothetical protein
VTSAKRKRIIRLARLWAHLTRTSHLPARGLTCETCGESGHVACLPWSDGPDTEHIDIELHNMEKRAA